MLGTIYMIRFRPDGTEYVGQTMQDLSDRAAQHAKSRNLLGRMIRKHGAEQFDVRVVAHCPKRLLNTTEQTRYYERNRELVIRRAVASKRRRKEAA